MPSFPAWRGRLDRSGSGMVTIKDVAARAGVSIKTVSRAMNGSAEIAAPTRQRVLDAATELDSRPNLLARRLVSGRTNTVGVVIPHSASYVFTHFSFNDVLRGIGEVLDRHGLDLLLHLRGDQAPYYDLYRKHQVDGLILLAIPTDDPLYRDLVRGSIPCVFTCRTSTDDNPTDWVDSDAVTGLGLVTAHLIDLGHERIAMLAVPPTLVMAQQQVAGFRRVMTDHGLLINEDWIRAGEYSFASGERIARELLAQADRPTALVCGDDMTAIGVMRRAANMGLDVPGDVSVTGFDDVVLAPYVYPALTTIRQDGYRKGRLAAETLIDVLAGTVMPGHPRKYPLDMEQMIRDSTVGAASRSGAMPMA